VTATFTVGLRITAAGIRLAEVSRTVADGGGLDLHPQQAAVLDADVVGERVSAGLEDVIAARGSGRHELQFDPFATFLKSAELSPTLHPSRPKTRPEKTKGATGGPRLSEYLVYISSLLNWWG
jgi:hypothetical protein